jgi:putative addiction module killer protein
VCPKAKSEVKRDKRARPTPRRDRKFTQSEFKDWLLSLRDTKAKARIAARFARAENGNLGDSKPIGEGVSEMRTDYGPGYRVYYRQRGNVLVILLCGGDKST